MLTGAKTKGAKLRFAEDAIAVPPPAVATRSGNEWAPRRVYLKPADFVKHGYSVGCMGCTWLQNGLGARRGHNEACRIRMEKAMEQDEDDKKRLALHKEKLDAYVAAEGEARIEKE